MSRTATDRNLVFGILALQMDFIARDALIAAMNAWLLEKHRSLEDILEARGALEPADRSLLEPLVRRHIEQHGDDPAKSLASLSSVEWIRAALAPAGQADPELRSSLGHLTATWPGGSAGGPPAAPPDAGRDPATASRFRILRFHARGGLGEVFVADDIELHREVALKQIQGRHGDHPESRTRFVREAEITGGLEHPGIVPVYGLGHYDDGRPFYAMRFIKGDSLGQAIQLFHRAAASGLRAGEWTLGLQKLLRRFLDVCNAIAYAHSRGVLHRDIKPGNIMVGHYGETLVVDWGLAKVVGTSEPAAEAALRPSPAGGSSETLPGSALGTPAFMSPEQAAGRLEQLGPPSDVYSLGATLYCLLAGEAPIKATDVDDALRRVREGEFPPPREVRPDVPRALEAICLKAMALTPEDRYPTPRALADDLERWLADEPVSAWREPISVRARGAGCAATARRLPSPRPPWSSHRPRWRSPIAARRGPTIGSPRPTWSSPAPTRANASPGPSPIAGSTRRSRRSRSITPASARRSSSTSPNSRTCERGSSRSPCCSTRRWRGTSPRPRPTTTVAAPSWRAAA